MRRISGSLVTLVVSMAALTFAAGEAFAQAKGARCGPGARERCMQTCAARGGQIRLCPQYCDKQIRERCGG